MLKEDISKHYEKDMLDIKINRREHGICKRILIYIDKTIDYTKSPINFDYDILPKIK